MNTRSARLIAVAFGCVLSFSSVAVAGNITPVPNANPKVPGTNSPNILSPELVEVSVAQGSMHLENPSALTSFYGYDNDGPMIPAPGVVPAAGVKIEATKTEPDKNTYLVLNNQLGADPNYKYGKHFLFQGHENGTGGQGYITRINLDADGAHHVTLMATRTVTGASIPALDGSTWYPFSHHLLFTSENAPTGGVFQATLDVPSVVEDMSGVFGNGGYEGIQSDYAGNLIIVEDVGGAKGVVNSHARQPNSFVYRFVPYNPNDLKQGGKMQALQVIGRNGSPIVFGNDADADILSQNTRDLNTYGLVFRTNWVTLHDTAVNGTSAFDANARAKQLGATPFKRPENGQFRPGSNFTEFYFDATGDTDNRTEAGTQFGGFGAIFKLTTSPHTNGGSIQLFFLCDQEHSGLDNVAFWNRDKVVFVEDAGDTLHAQRNALDSAYMFDVRLDYSSGAEPVRVLAEGRDASATLDSQLGAFAGFNNDGDNEITGWHQSDGDPGVDGLLGAKIPTPFENGWRLFYTAQHGDNHTFQIVPASVLSGDEDGRFGNGIGRGHFGDDD